MFFLLTQVCYSYLRTHHVLGRSSRHILRETNQKNTGKFQPKKLCRTLFFCAQIFKVLHMRYLKVLCRGFPKCSVGITKKVPPICPPPTPALCFTRESRGSSSVTLLSESEISIALVSSYSSLFDELAERRTTDRRRHSEEENRSYF